LNSKPISYQELEEDEEDDSIFITVQKTPTDLAAATHHTPSQKHQQRLRQEQQAIQQEQQKDQVSLISQFLESPFGILDDEKPHKLLKDLFTQPPSATTAPTKPVVFQGYDFNLLSPTTTSTISPSLPQFPKDEFLPFHDWSQSAHHQSSVLSTDASLSALGSSLSALQGLPVEQLGSLDPFDLFFEVPKSPQSSCSAEDLVERRKDMRNFSSSSSSTPPKVVNPTSPVSSSDVPPPPPSQKTPSSFMESNIDPTWNENLLLGGGHLADYFAQIEDQYLL
jgi:hypothetical protein